MDAETTAVTTAEQARDLREQARAAGKHELAQRYDAAERAAHAREAGEVVPAEDGDDLPPGWATAGLDADDVRDARQLAHELIAADPDVADVLDSAMILRDGHPVPLGDHPAVLGALARIAKALKRTSAAPAKATASASPVRALDGLEERIDSVRQQKRVALAKGSYRRALALDAEERRLLGQLYGNGPIVGQRGRVA